MDESITTSAPETVITPQKKLLAALQPDNFLPELDAGEKVDFWMKWFDSDRREVLGKRFGISVPDARGDYGDVFINTQRALGMTRTELELLYRLEKAYGPVDLSQLAQWSQKHTASYGRANQVDASLRTENVRSGQKVFGLKSNDTTLNQQEEREYLVSRFTDLCDIVGIQESRRFGLWPHRTSIVPDEVRKKIRNGLFDRLLTQTEVDRENHISFVTKKVIGKCRDQRLIAPEHDRTEFERYAQELKNGRFRDDISLKELPDDQQNKNSRVLAAHIIQSVHMDQPLLLRSLIGQLIDSAEVRSLDLNNTAIRRDRFIQLLVTLVQLQRIELREVDRVHTESDLLIDEGEDALNRVCVILGQISIINQQSEFFEF